jgi:hypothetical protein
MTKCFTNEIRFDINCEKCDGNFEIDAIQLIGTLDEDSEHRIITLDSISQENSINMSSKYEKYINDEKESDVSIYVGKKKCFNATKIILISQSEFFENLFFSSMKESKRSYISLPTLDPEIFEEILYFLYTGMIKSKELNYSKLLNLLSNADYLQIYGILDLCFAYLSQDFEMFLNSKDFMNLSEGMLIYFLKSDLHESVDEYFLFQRCVDWSKFQISKFNLKEKIQEVLAPILFHLKLNSLSDKILEIENSGFVDKKFLIYFYKSLIKK